MGKAYVTGPCAIHCGVGALYAPIFLGHAERGVRIRIAPEYEPVHNDLGGRVPIDWLYEGETAIISADLTRFNEAVYELIAARPRTSTLGSVPGVNVPGDIGTLMITEGFAYPLWLVFPYQSKPALSDLPAGYRFLATWLLGPDEFEPGAVQAQRKRLIWQAGRAISVSSTGATFLLYDGNMAGLGPID